MSKTIEGIYSNGKIQLSETPDDIRVIVSFLPQGAVDLKEHGIDKVQAAELRARFACFAEDWQSPEMRIYDNYDEEKAKLQKQ